MASIRQTQTGRFEARVWHNHQRLSRTFESLAHAQHWASGIQCGEIRPTTLKNTNLPETKHSLLSLTIHEGLERYLTEVVGQQKGRVQATYRVRQLQAEPLASKTLQTLHESDVRALRDQELGRGCSGATVARKLAVLSSMLLHAQHEWGLAIDNPVRKVRRPPPSKPRHRRLTQDEEKRLLDACHHMRTPHLAEILELAIETAMRKGELLGLTWDAVDLNRRIITLIDTKNGHARYIPMSKRAYDILNAAKISGVDSPIALTQCALDMAWKRLIRRTGLEGLRFHDLRHEGLSRWAHKLGGDVFKLALVSGHRNLQMAQRYTHPSNAELLSTLQYQLGNQTKAYKNFSKG